MQSRIAEALIHLTPKAQWHRQGDTLIWLSPEITQPTPEDIDLAILDILDREVWSELREQRNRLLAETDWMANSDVTMSPEMAEYRQALRDLPETVDINNPVYPEKPTGA
jgi:hypothetical protein